MEHDSLGGRDEQERYHLCRIYDGDVKLVAPVDVGYRVVRAAATAVGHHLNNAHTPILGHLQLLLGDGSLTPTMRIKLKTILSCTESASMLTQAIVACLRGGLEKSLETIPLQPHQDGSSKVILDLTPYLLQHPEERTPSL